jgi:hypothetical protein
MSLEDSKVDIKRIFKEKRIGRHYRLFYIISLLVVWVVVFAGVGRGEDGRVPTEPPKVVSHTPDINAQQVPVNGVVSVVWDRPMRPDTDFTVTGPEGFVDGAFRYDPESFTVTFRPEQNLIPDRRYGVLVAGQVDLEGQVQQEAYLWNFNTVTPTSVSIVSFSTTDEGLGQSWWWLSWPSLMAAVSILSLAGFLTVWGRRRLISTSEKSL